MQARAGALGDLPAQALPLRDVTVHADHAAPVRVPVGPVARAGRRSTMLISQVAIVPDGDATAAAQSLLRDMFCPAIGVPVATAQSVEWASLFRVQQGTTATRILFAGSARMRLGRAAPAVLFALPAVQSLGWRQASGLSISYRGGPLAVPGRFRSGPRAGDRAPDVACVRAGGSSTTLLETVAGGRWVLLVGDRAVAARLLPVTVNPTPLTPDALAGYVRAVLAQPGYGPRST
ncbi:hypothetical protein [Pseudonocardia sp. GCM10023141]|uniref:hypothetical protein n=1 Tax=Pseudonocardia sp. GCM10023141 TaxID=3252653 RepID=UPI00361D9079